MSARGPKKTPIRAHRALPRVALLQVVKAPAKVSDRRRLEGKAAKAVSLCRTASRAREASNLRHLLEKVVMAQHQHESQQSISVKVPNETFRRSVTPPDGLPRGHLTTKYQVSRCTRTRSGIETLTTVGSTTACLASGERRRRMRRDGRSCERTKKRRRTEPERRLLKVKRRTGLPARRTLRQR